MNRVAIAILLLNMLTAGRVNAQLRTDTVIAMGVAAPDTSTQGSSGSITGTLRDERGNPIVNAYVECSAGGVIRGRELTDFDGIYTIRPLQPERLTVRFKFQGKELTITDVTLAAGVHRTLNGTLDLSKPGMTTCTVVIRCWGNPFIDPKHPGGRTTHTSSLFW